MCDAALPSSRDMAWRALTFNLGPADAHHPHQHAPHTLTPVSFSFPAQATHLHSAMHGGPLSASGAASGAGAGHTHTPASSLPTSAFLGSAFSPFAYQRPGPDAAAAAAPSPPLCAIGLEDMDASIDSLDTSLSAVSGSVGGAPASGAAGVGAAGTGGELRAFSLGATTATSVSPALQAISLARSTPHSRARRLSALSASGSVTGSLAALTGLAAPVRMDEADEEHAEGEGEEGEGEEGGENGERPSKRARGEGDGDATSSSPAPSSSARSASAALGSPAAAAKKGNKALKGKVGPAITTTPASGVSALPAAAAAAAATATSATAPTTGDLLAPPPAPAPKRPWNTSPQSTHLPSGSQLINPLTNELDLKPELLEGLTKEEIRKVKNRASAQRSRTRKWEVQEGLKGENERLREELERLRNEMEGNEEDEDAPELGTERRVGQVPAVAPPLVPPPRDEEKEAMKSLIERLRREVAEEKAARAKAEAEVWSLKAQLDAAITSATAIAGMAAASGRGQGGIPSPATSAEDEIVSIGESVGDAHSSAAERGEMKLGVRERGVVAHGGRAKAAGKDPKGVLMMVRRGRKHIARRFFD